MQLELVLKLLDKSFIQIFSWVMYSKTATDSFPLAGLTQYFRSIFNSHVLSAFIKDGKIIKKKYEILSYMWSSEGKAFSLSRLSYHFCGCCTAYKVLLTIVFDKKIFA